MVKVFKDNSVLKQKGILLLTLFYLSCFNTLIGQTIKIEGIVTDGANKPLKYVSVGIIGKPIGTVTDFDGNFYLWFEKDEIESDDTIKFSHIGFSSKSLSLNEIIKDTYITVSLKEKSQELKTIDIISNAITVKEIGTKHKSLVNGFVSFSINEYPNQNLGSEIGRKFEIRHENTFLDSFRFYLERNDYDTLLFRLNVYSIESFKPKINLLSKEILCEVFQKQIGWICIDLSKYSLYVDEDIVVSIEWIGKSKNGSILFLPIIMPTTSVHFYKFGSQNDWKRFDSMSTPMVLKIKY